MSFGGLNDFDGFGIQGSLAKPIKVDALQTQPIMIGGVKLNSPDLNNPFAEL
jgi:hypothetical protein